MKVVGWDNGSPNNRTGEGYGIRIVPRDRDRYFQRTKSSVNIELENGNLVKVKISDSFWGDSTELRSPKIGKWMLSVGLAPWSISSPPNLRLEPGAKRKFKFRLTS
jgi:hypothetical protein